MCGLVGVFSASLTGPKLEAFRWLIKFDEVRGEDSTGIAARVKLKSEDTWKVYNLKQLGPSSNLFETYHELFDRHGRIKKPELLDISLLLGHNRFATRGEITKKNAHPFSHKHIIGAHNGTISFGLENLPDGKEKLVGDTDSERIFYAISEGWDLEKIFKTIKGAAALTWWNTEERSLNLFRNSERPLFVYHNRVLEAIFYASERWMLEKALDRAKINFIGTAIESLPINTHRTCTLKANGDIQVENKTVETFHSYAVSRTIYNGGSSYSYNTVSANDLGGFDFEDKGGTVVELGGKRKDLDPTFRLPTGWIDPDKIPETTKEASIKAGCCCCSTDFKPNSIIKWLEPYAAVCWDCSQDFFKI
jgi:glucosamine 6-phosphate synthetase-like amidotransferase/phosphosugar isomerase protein